MSSGLTSASGQRSNSSEVRHALAQHGSFLGTICHRPRGRGAAFPMSSGLTSASGQRSPFQEVCRVSPQHGDFIFGTTLSGVDKVVHVRVEHGVVP